MGSPHKKLLTASKDVEAFNGKKGAALYNALDDIRRAGFLNVMAKSLATPLANGRVVASYFKHLMKLRGDRFFVAVARALREEVKNSASAGMFTEEPGGMHDPPPGFTRAGSFKTDEAEAVERHGPHGGFLPAHLRQARRDAEDTG